MFIFFIIFYILSIISRFNCAKELTEFNNTCSGLGINSPTTTRDCQVYVLDKGYCCYIEITQQKKQRKSCRFVENLKTKYLREIRDQLTEEYEADDISIECNSKIYNIKYIIFLLVMLLIV